MSKLLRQTKELELGFVSQGLIGTLALILLLVGVTGYMAYRLFEPEAPADLATTDLTPVAKPETALSKQDDAARWSSLSNAQTRSRGKVLSGVGKSNAAKGRQATKDPLTGGDGSEFKLSPQMEQELLALLPKSSEGYPSGAALWQTGQPVQNTSAGGAAGDDVPAKRVRANPEALATLQAGDTLDLPGYDGEENESATVESRRKLDNGLSLVNFKGNDGSDLTGGQAVIGKKTTEVNYVTRNGTYTLSIDNQTGEGTLISDADLKRKYEQESDLRIMKPEVPEAEPDNG